MKSPVRFFAVATLLALCGAFSESLAATVTYTMQTGNFNSLLTERNNNPPYAGTYNNGATELAQYANGGSFGNTPGAAAFQTFTTTGNGTSGTVRALQVGDTFTITGFVSANPSAGGRIGISFRDSTSYSNFAASTDSSTEARFQLDNTGGWKIYNNSTTVDSGLGSNADRTFTIKITSDNTFNATIGSTTYYDLAMAASGGTIDSFAIYTFGDSNQNSFWKNASLSDTGTVEFGNDATSGQTRTISGIIGNGLAANSTTSTVNNAVSISGAAGSQVNFSGNNTYSGATTINNNATLELQHANALGSTAAGTTVNSGGSMKLYSATGISFASEALTLNGTGTNNVNGALLNTGGDNTWNGAITIGSSNARINADTTGASGSLTIAGNIAGGARTIFVGAQGASSGRTGGNITISSTVSGSGATLDGATTTIFKDGVGALTLSGNNNYTGATLFNEGTIFIGHNAAFGTGTLQIHFGNFSATKVLASSNATDRSLSNNMNIYGSNLTLGAAGYTGGITVNGAISLGNDTSGSNDRTITIASGTSHSFGGVVSGNTSNKLIKAGAGSLTLANNNTFNAGVQLNEGTLLVGHNNALGTGLMQVQFDIAGTKTLASSSSAAYTLNNNINIYNDLTLGQTSGGTGSLTLGGTIQLGNEANQNRAITVNGSHTISGSIQGARGIVKQGGGTLRLSGINTSTGQIYIDDGIIDLNGGSLGNGTIEIGAGTGGAANATLRVTSGSFSRGITVNSDASAGNRTIDFANTTGTATLSGTVALEKTAEVSVANGGTGLLSGVVSGAGGLTKSGAGNLEVSNANTFDGNVIINGGKVKMSHATALGDTGTITVNAGADLEVAGGITVARNLTLSAVNGAIRGGRLMSSGANEKNTYSGTVAVNNSEFDVASGNTLDVTGKISGTGTVTKTGAGELQLSNTGNDYSGITDAQNGTLTASSITNSGTASAIGTGSEVKVGSASTAGTFKYTGSSASMNRTVTVGSAGGTINVNDAAATMTLAGTLAGSGATLTKTGSGKLALGSGSSTTVSTIAIQQGTLLLGASNQIDNSTAITLSGGTLALDGKTDTVGRLTVSANSIFDFGTAGGSATSFTFSDFNTSAYGSNSFVMTINNAVAGSSIVFNTNYDGNTTFNSFASKIQYGTSGQFGQISFGTGTTTLLVAIPDARVYSAAVALIFLIGIAEVRRRRKCAQRAV